MTRTPVRFRAARSAAAGLAGLALLATLSLGAAEPAAAAGGDKVPELPVVTGLTAAGGAAEPSQLTRKVNEYEGQHRLTGKDPEVPVSPNLTRKVNEYEGQHRLAGGEAAAPSAGSGGKVGEVPVITG